MRIASLDAPGHMVVCERPTPPLRPDHVRVAMRAAGVCSSDIARSHGGAYHHPLVLGHELAGVVLQWGAGIQGSAPPVGTRCTIFPLLPCFSCGPCAQEEYARCRDYDYFGSRRDGGFAEFVDTPPWNLLPIPDSVSLSDAALTEPFAVVVHALDRLALPTGATEPLAILGCGFLGLLAVALLRSTHPELPITVLGRHPGKLARAEELGATCIPADDHTAFLIENEASFGYVLEAAGAPATFTGALTLAAPGGRVVWMGNPSSDVTLPQALASQVLRKELTLCGTWNSRYRGAAPSDWTVALDHMAGGLRPSDFVTSTVDLDGLPALLARLHAHKQGLTSFPELKSLVRIAP